MEPLANLFHRCSQYTTAVTLQLFFHQPFSIEEKELKPDININHLLMKYEDL